VDARNLEERIHSLYGEVDWASAVGLLHVTAFAERMDAVLAMGPAAPASATDRFVLGLARARANLILTTGAILRSEPTLRHRFAEDEETDELLRIWRRNVCGLENPPALLVFSRSGDFPADHPALRDAGAGMVWTSKEGCERLGLVAGRLSVEEGILAGSADASLAESVAALLRAARSRFEAATILIEAGPTLSREFYRTSSGECPRIDELLLSRFEGDVVGEALGPQFEMRSAIPKLFARVRTSVRVEESSGSWIFERYRNASSR